MKPSRRWPEFTCSTIVLAVLLCGVFLAVQPQGWVVWAQAPTTGSAPIAIEPATTVPGVTAPPPVAGPAVAAIETSPTAPASLVGGFMPIETETTLREIDESAPINIFSDPAVAAKLLVGRKPFLYDAKGRFDPMVIPWIRQEILNTELISEAQKYMQDADALTDPEAKKARYLLAIQELDRVIKADPTSSYGKRAQVLKDKIRALIEQMPLAGATPTPVVTKRPELPPWVASNTRAILYDASPKHASVVLVGDDMLRVGGTVPKYPEVKIVEITANTVVYDYMGLHHTVKVEVDVSKE